MSSCRSTLPLYYPMNVYSTSKVSDAYPIPTKIPRVFIASELGCDLPPDTGKPELFPGKRVVGGDANLSLSGRRYAGVKRESGLLKILCGGGCDC